jgi:hypothetical protein
LYPEYGAFAFASRFILNANKEVSMLRIKGFSVLLLGGVLQACATAPASTEETASASTTTQSASPQATADANPDERVCREVAGTGWRFGTREECKTRAQWEASEPGADP